MYQMIVAIIGTCSKITSRNFAAVQKQSSAKSFDPRIDSTFIYIVDVAMNVQFSSIAPLSIEHNVMGMVLFCSLTTNMLPFDTVCLKTSHAWRSLLFMSYKKNWGERKILESILVPIM